MFGKKGTVFLKDLAGAYMLISDVDTQTSTAGLNNFANYIAMIKENGGFEGMVRNW